MAEYGFDGGDFIFKMPPLFAALVGNPRPEFLDLGLQPVSEPRVIKSEILHRYRQHGMVSRNSPMQLVWTLSRAAASWL
ncbi:hypothetical protein NGR_c06830 [Sinorhizobium fredii NGR234]|uniref:Uncharacterized protein n=1 Tax=Sinorhizobium fredii (strain NBRC 101917 / NGR234) TaxID=394 RepID=C3MIC8_SINFN|nr:hypothetical protein NGR_c06830 [Sinorhizobium fredii NGR234]